MVRGVDRVGWAFTFAAAAYNLFRLPKLLAGTAPDSTMIGQRIVRSNLWDNDDFDLVGLASLTFDDHGYGEITVGAVTAALDIECDRAAIFFR